MTGTRGTTLACLLVLVPMLTACSSAGTPGAAMSRPAAPSTSSAGPPAPVSPASSSSAAPCPRVGAAVVPDGTWAGPITLDVPGGAPKARTRSSGSGELQVIVEDGRVTGGTWALTGHSTGKSTTDAGTAKVDLDAQISGTVVGTAAAPVLKGHWTITGKATVTSPVQATAPIDEAGHDSETLTVETTACDRVTGTFVPSFKTDNPMAAFQGRARWVGRPTS